MPPTPTPPPLPKTGRRILVGPRRPIKTLAEAISKYVAGDALILDSGTFPVQKTLTLPRSLAIVSESVIPPVIQYRGGDHSSPLSVGFGAVLTLKGVDFSVNFGAYALNVTGGLNSTQVTVRGGGGAVKSGGSSHFIKCDYWHVPERAKHYIWYVSALTVQDDDAIFKQRPGFGFVLTHSTNGDGTAVEHIVRCHNVNSVRVSDCHLKQTVSNNAALRIHDCGDVLLERDEVDGDVNLAPMGEENGGKNLPPGPKRKFYDAMRLKSLTARLCNFRTGDFKINAGLLDGLISECSISDSRGGAVIDTPFPYMGRPRSRLRFENVAFSHKDGTGRVFSSEEGARDMQVGKGSRFNDKPFSKLAG